VDDSLHTRHLYSEYLTFRGLGVVSAPDGGSALVMARSMQPDAIVMDLAMPGVDGITATRQLKADPRTRAIPVLILTGFGYRAIEQGAASHVPGPTDLAWTRITQWRTLLAAINMPAYGVLVGGIEASDAAAYAAAYTEAVRTVMFSTGVLTLLAAPIAWIAIGGRDPLDTVWQHQDERGAVPVVVSG
jgi:CheY-like chemotaxis protein